MRARMDVNVAADGEDDIVDDDVASSDSVNDVNDYDDRGDEGGEKDEEAES